MESLERKSQRETIESAEGIDLMDVCEKYDILVAHGVFPHRLVVSTSTKPKTDATTQLKIVLGLRPTIGAYTIHHGDYYKNRWGDGGVFLNGGKIIRAHHTDGATFAVSLTERKTRETDRPLAEQIDKAIKNRDGYNELTIADPTIAGCFIATDRNTTDWTEFWRMMNEYIEQFSSLPLPLYELVNGEIFEASIVKGKIVPQKKKTFQEILHNGFVLDENVKRRFAEEGRTSLAVREQKP